MERRYSRGVTIITIECRLECRIDCNRFETKSFVRLFVHSLIRKRYLCAVYIIFRVKVIDLSLRARKRARVMRSKMVEKIPHAIFFSISSCCSNRSIE